MKIQDYVNRRLLGWMTYNHHFGDQSMNKMLYLYPQVMHSENGQLTSIDPEDFPKHGAVQAWIRRKESAEEICDELGQIVTIQFRTAAIAAEENKNNVYTFQLDTGLESEIDIRRFDGQDMWQVVPVRRTVADVCSSRRAPLGSMVLDNGLWTTNIMLRLGNSLYGPFAYDISGSDLVLSGVREFNYMVGEFSVGSRANDTFMVHDENDIEIATFVSSAAFPDLGKALRTDDWMTDETLLDGVLSAMRQDTPKTREQRRRMREQLVPSLSKGNEELLFALTPPRIERAKELLAREDRLAQTVHDIASYAIGIEPLRTELVRDLTGDQLDQLAEAMQARQGSGEPDEGAAASSAPGRAERTIQELTARNEKLTRELAEALRTLRPAEEVAAAERRLGELRGALTDLEAQYEKKRAQSQMLDEQIDQSMSRFSDGAQQVARLLDSQLVSSIMHKGRAPAADHAPGAEPAALHEPMDASQIVKRVTDYVRNRAKRDVTENEIANYLICLTQGFITTFAGEPGTGKTSLCTLLAKSLGLVTGNASGRFVDVSVERGWTSHKDFIGYYNPLTNDIVESNPDVYDAFVRLSEETGEGPYAPFFILLDEANLSPIEHYWATFLRFCDMDSAASRQISLGGTERFAVPPQLRFLATVNFDHTTEELSPRFLDRTWVITLDPERIDDETDEAAENMPDMVSFESLRRAFGADTASEVDEELLRKWDAIQTIFRDNALPIMPRNLRMVRSYCAAASRTMHRDSPGTKFAPLDYAVAQKILPMVSGSGKRYDQLMDNLQRECQNSNMPVTAKHLERMRDAADRNLGLYNFFAR